MTYDARMNYDCAFHDVVMGCDCTTDDKAGCVSVSKGKRACACVAVLKGAGFVHPSNAGKRGTSLVDWIKVRLNK